MPLANEGKMMTKLTTAQRIFKEANDKAAARNEAREICTHTTAANCIERTYHFYDGSKLQIDVEGYRVIE